MTPKREEMHSEEVRQQVLVRISEGESLRSICADDGMPAKSAVLRWCDEDTAFRDQYTRAMLMRADAKFAELDDVSEDAVQAESAVQVAGLRLKADNIKWQLGKLNPKKYGEKIEATHEVGESITRIVRQIMRD